ncbi:hypothetical protein [Iningainema tapete]|uniref:hypothetical protein n=1 Tax=Iningainema tapete TaxID=2806730 RepID=UPI001EE2AE37|nr:hypothetical protein [Iningainema tapete]
MTASNVRQQILEHLEILPSEQVKTLLLTWLTSTSEDLEDFERLLINPSVQTTEESFEFGEVDTALNFQPLTEVEMVEQSKSALEAYRCKGSGVPQGNVIPFLYEDAPPKPAKLRLCLCSPRL